MEIYMDNSATTKPSKTAIDAVINYMNKDYYNPAALYAPAAKVASAIKAAKELFINDMRISTGEIIFNSGGTEGNNTVIFGVASKHMDKIHAVTSSVEHASVLQAFEHLKELGHQVDFIDPDEKGSIRIKDLENAIRPNTAIVSFMQVNNETGAINDIEAISRTVRKTSKNCVIHCDGVQAYPKLRFPAGAVDAYTISGHKFHAPRGVGMLYLSDKRIIEPLLYGGGQQGGLRCGTENTAGVMGMTAALNDYVQTRQQYVSNMLAVKQRLFAGLSFIKDINLNGPALHEGAPHILSVGFAGIKGETLLHALEEKGIYVGLGSACSASKSSISHVLKAIGVPKVFAEGTIRFSFCYQNTVEQADIVAETVIECVNKLRRFTRR